MRRLCFFLGCMFWALTPIAPGQQVAQEFSGSGETTTGFFTTTDRWEVRWNARQAVSVAVMAQDGSLVSGASGVLRGSLFVPAGGRYYLKITDGTALPPAPAPAPVPAAPTPAPAPAVAGPTPATNAPPAAGTNAPPAGPTNASPAPDFTIVPDPLTPAPAPPPEVSWHVQVLQLPAPGTVSTESLTVFSPYFVIPDGALMGAPAPAAPVGPRTLTADQLRGVIKIKGDTAEGYGSLVRYPDGVYIATHFGVLEANPNLQFITSSGTLIKPISAKAATDRDLVLIAVASDQPGPFPFPGKNDPPLAAGDEVLTPLTGSEDPVAARRASITNVAPDEIDFDMSPRAATAGVPLLVAATGAVVAIVSTPSRPDYSERIAASILKNAPPPHPFHFYSSSVPLAGVAGWEPIDLTAFASETSLLKAFHDTTRSLDSYLNSRPGDNDRFQRVANPPDDQFFKKNDKVRAANDSYHKLAANSDTAGQIDAARELLFDLQTVADSNVKDLQGFPFTVSYTRQELTKELAYRQAIKNELDGFNDAIGHFNQIAQNH